MYSQVLKGAEYMGIANQLEIHAKQELDHALHQIDLATALGEEAPNVNSGPKSRSQAQGR